MLANELIDFINKSPSVFHVVDNVRTMLKEAGFIELSENERWAIKKGGRYFVTRNGSAIISFVIPEGEVKNFRMIASHSDSPTFRIKNNPEIVAGQEYIVLNTEKYGGMIMASWFDRPLSFAGRVMVDTKNGVEIRLVNIDRDSLIIPNLAIHMDRDINTGYNYNASKDTLPLFEMGSEKGGFMDCLAAECCVDKDNILSHELYLYNRQKGSVWGKNNEFISAPRLDDLQCAFISLKAILDADNENSICMSLIFDNEEVGSGSCQGADSDFLECVTDRIMECLGINYEDRYCVLADSFLISADNAHAVHPNHTDKADQTNRPYLNKGIVIKNNASMKYVTNGVSEAAFKKICNLAGVETQSYFNRSDIAGGSTLGNISLRHVSIDSIDIGLPELAMHSCFETAGVKDMDDLLKVFTKYYQLIWNS